MIMPIKTYLRLKYDLCNYQYILSINDYVVSISSVLLLLLFYNFSTSGNNN